MAHASVQDMILERLREIREDNARQNEKLDRIEHQTTLTNGRVTRLEGIGGVQSDTLIKIDSRVVKLENNSVRAANNVEERWRWREYIGKYGFQFVTWLISLTALYLTYMRNKP